MTTSVEKIVDEIFELYERYGCADYIGEPVSQIEHMSQAAQLAKREGLMMRLSLQHSFMILVTFVWPLRRKII